VGLGANLGDAEHNLRRAVAKLREVIDVHAVSSLYRTEPVGVRDQPDFLNAVLHGTTQLSPRALIEAFAAIEAEAGRAREMAMGPRTLDLDLLLYDDLVHREPGVEVPHPRMADRRFVLAPLAEIAPDAVHPELGLAASALLRRLSDDAAVERLERDAWPSTREG